MNDGFKVIDFRNRPPLPQYGLIFDMKKTYFQDQLHHVYNRGTNTFTKSMEMKTVGTEEGLAEWMKEIDEAGVSSVVVNGRYMFWRIPTSTMTSKDIHDFSQKYPGRVHGLAAIDLDNSPKAAAEDVEKAIKEYGFKGANIEPGYKDGYRGISIDDPALGPIMEVLEAGGAFLQIQTGMLGGADIGNNNPPALDRFLQAHPKLQVVLAHGGYPYMSEMLGLATKHPHLHICPDMYMFFPGGQLYAWNLNNLPDTFVYGSSYPFASIREPIEETLAFRSHPLYKVRDDVMGKYLYGNAARLLGLES